MIGLSFSYNVIVCLSSTGVCIVWRSANYLTQNLTLHIMKVWIFSMTLYPLSHWRSWQTTSEPITGFGQCGFSWLSRRSNAPPGCSESSSTLDAFVTNGFFNADVLFVIQWSMSRCHFLSFHLFSFASRYETLVVGIYLSFFLIPWCWTSETDYFGRQNLWRQSSPSKPDTETHNDSWASPFPLHIVVCK